jgi:hypothetical protein
MDSRSSVEMGMGLEGYLDGFCFLLTQNRHFRAPHGTIQNLVKRVPELRTDKARKWRGGSGDHLSQRLVGTLGW